MQLDEWPTQGSSFCDGKETPYPENEKDETTEQKDSHKCIYRMRPKRSGPNFPVRSMNVYMSEAVTLYI